MDTIFVGKTHSFVTKELVPTSVDLGLPSGLQWATCNIGGGCPEDYGDYFAWAETSPKEFYDWSRKNPNEKKDVYTQKIKLLGY